MRVHVVGFSRGRVCGTPGALQCPYLPPLPNGIAPQMNKEGNSLSGSFFVPQDLNAPVRGAATAPNPMPMPTVELAKRGVPVNYDPTSSTGSMVGHWKTCRGPFSAERNAIHYTRVGPSPE
jgi:hypothetical protein